MPYVTQTRSRAANRVYQIFSPRGQTISSGAGWDVVPNASETTASFRSGGGMKGLGTLTNDELKKNVYDGAFDRFRDSSFDNGHSFSSTKRFTTMSHENVRLVGASGNIYEGPLSPKNLADLVSYPAYIVPNTGFYETDLINKSIPTKPSAGLAEILGELNEGIPKISSNILDLVSSRGAINAKTSYNALSKDYLNYEFGVTPLVGGLLQAGAVVRDINKRMIDFDRNSGRLVRRRRYVKPVVTTQVVPRGGSTSDFATYWANSDFLAPGSFVQSVTDTIQSSTDIWFSGAWQYYTKLDSSMLSRMQNTEQLLHKIGGMRLTADLLWQLTPWTWLVDWQTDVGKQIQNASLMSNDSLVMKYGYLMCKTTSTVTRTWSGLRFRGGVDLGPISVTLHSERKTRKRASPYGGFNGNPNTYTSRQWAILAALGMTKGSTMLRTE